MMTRLIWLGLAIATTATAGGRMEEVIEVNSDVTVNIENIAGEVQIDAWDRNQVRVLGDLGDGVETLRVTGNKSLVEIEVVLSQRWNNHHVDDTDLIIQVPRGASLEIETTSADIIVSGVEGARFVAETVSGDVEAGIRSKYIEIGTVSGDLELAGAADTAALSTVSGDLVATGLNGELSATSVSGDVEVSGSVIQRGRFEAVSGDVELIVGLSKGGTITAESMSGALVVILPREVSARIEAETFSGSLKSDIGEVIRAKYGPQKRLETTAVGGDGRIRLTSHSGDVRIRRQ